METKITVNDPKPAQPVQEVKPQSFYTEEDKTFAQFNAAKVAFDALYAYVAPRSDGARLSLAPISLGFHMLQYVAAYKTMPWEKMTLAEKAILHPAFGFFSYFTAGLFPNLHRVYNAVVLGETLRNAVPKLYTSLTQLRKQPGEAGKAALIHTANIAGHGYFTWNVFEMINLAVEEVQAIFEKFQEAQGHFGDFEEEFRNFEETFGRTHGRGAPPPPPPGAHCPPKQPDWKILTQKPLIEQLNSPELATTCPAHAARVLKIDGVATCKKINAAFKKTAFAVHPDRNPKNKEAADQAFKNAGLFADTLRAKYSCPTK
jgi:hypothetical protein